MRLSNSAAVVVVAASLCVPALAAAQEPPARDFSLLYTRLVPGDTVWVTDAQGREVKGRIGSITYESIALEGDSPRTFDAARFAGSAVATLTGEPGPARRSARLSASASASRPARRTLRTTRPGAIRA